jgi:hypothetical protein
LASTLEELNNERETAIIEAQKATTKNKQHKFNQQSSVFHFLSVSRFFLFSIFISSES